MVKKKKELKQEVLVPCREVELAPITDSLKENYMPYAMSVIVSRAIPEIDGFKPSQRKILYTMYRMGLLKGARSKSADIVGQTMALNPHGDQSIYDTMVRMTRGNGALINPWIDSKGNFGRVYSRDMQCAAYRYTEARLDPSCEMLLGGLNKDAVDFVDNYSGTMKEPVLLPAEVPTILLNANQGIAVGMASNICSFNLKELCETCIALMKDPACDLLTFLPAPDFSTGAEILYDREQMRQIYESGRGSFKMRARHRVDSKHNIIEIYELPYTSSIESVIDDITAQVKKGKIKELVDVRDETDLQGLKIAIEYKKQSDVDLLLAKLYRSTSLTASFSCNFNLLIGNQPRVLGVRSILTEWLSWRRSCLLREFAFEREQLEKQLHLLRALESVLLDIDEAIRIIRRTEREAEVLPALCQAFDLDLQQAEYVAEIKLRHLNREYLLKRTQEIAELEERIAALQALQESEAKQNQYIAQQLKAYAKKYGRERRSDLVSPEEITLPAQEDLIEDYRLKIFLTREGYIKKLPLVSLRSAGELKTKDGDSIIQEEEGSNRHEVLFFTNKAQVYKLRAYELPDHKPSELGEFSPNLLELESDERVLAIHLAERLDSGYFTMIFADGRVAKIERVHYDTKNKRKKLLKAFYDGAELVQLFFHEEENGHQEILLASSQRRLILLNTDLIPLKKTRNSQGVQAMTLRHDYHLTQASLLSEADAEAYAYYRVRTLPSAGRFIKEETVQGRQVDLFS